MVFDQDVELDSHSGTTIRARCYRNTGVGPGEDKLIIYATTESMRL